MIDLPGTVKIGAVDYAIVPVGALGCLEGQSVGMFRHARQRIDVADFMPPAATAQVVVHEIVHGIWEQWGIGEAAEEATATRLALGLTAVMRDNPGLVRALLDALRGPAPGGGA